MRALLIATSNPGKINEIKAILSQIPYKIITLSEIKINIKAEESGRTFEENAILKAKTYGEKTNLLTLAEDSGLEVDALGGKPGVLSARYCQGSDLDRITKLLRKLNGIPKEKRTATFKTVVVVYNPQTKKTYTYSGISKGYILEKPLGENGFGYDPVFYNLDLKKTNAQADIEEKNLVSHRAKALKKAVEYLLSC